MQNNNRGRRDRYRIVVGFTIYAISFYHHCEFISQSGPNRKGNNLYKMIQKCIILESILEFEHAKGPTCLKYLHSSTGILSLIISQFVLHVD
jgi:hypothetical protein